MYNYNKFREVLFKYEPDLEVRVKEKSYLMKVLSVILFFVPDFMVKFTTTIGSTIYMPTRYFTNPEAAVSITAHEYVHIRQSKKYTLPLFTFLYLFPQSLGILALLLLLPAFLISTTFGIVTLICLLFLAPIPAYFRMRFELEGYNMTLFMIYRMMIDFGYNEAEILSKVRVAANQIDIINFRRAPYYFMWPFGVEKKFAKTVELLQKPGYIETTDAAFLHVKEALAEAKAVYENNL